MLERGAQSHTLQPLVQVLSADIRHIQHIIRTGHFLPLHLISQTCPQLIPMCIGHCDSYRKLTWQWEEQACIESQLAKPKIYQCFGPGAPHKAAREPRVMNLNQSEPPLVQVGSRVFPCHLRPSDMLMPSSGLCSGIGPIFLSFKVLILMS